MDAKALRAHLEHSVLLFDGATGTYAKSMADWPSGPVELACMILPENVESLHRSYIDAGSMAIKTNTFAAHVGLACIDEAQQKTVIGAAVKAARRAAGNRAFVFADIGPAPDIHDAENAYCRMAEQFIADGVSCYLFETMPTDAGIINAAAYIRKRIPDAFIAVSFAANPDGFTRSGELASALIARMDACDNIDAVGLNCICGAYHMRRLLENLPATEKHLIALPNAGYPHVIDGRTYYDSDPLYYAEQVCACVHAGARMIGGCCGTRPEHISSIVLELQKTGAVPKNDEESAQQKRSIDYKSRILEKLNAGKRPILVELDPPRDSGIESFMTGAKMLRDAGADAITIADCPIGRARMDSSLLACKLKRELDIEVLPHMTCRDRNVNATKALLLGLSMEGVHNVLIVTGDPVPADDRGNIKSVFQFNSRMMARFVRGLSDAGETVPFYVCGALNINAPNFEMELERAKDKEASGVQAFLTQPVLSEQAVINIERARRELSGKIMGGLFPVVSEKNARFLRSEVTGITLDERVINAYEGLDREQSEALAVRLCSEAARRIAPYVDGYYIMTPFQRIKLVRNVMEAIKAL